MAVLTAMFVPGATVGPQVTVQSFLFRTFIRPRIGAPMETESFRPPRFAQQMGLVMAGAALVLGLAGVDGRVLRVRRARDRCVVPQRRVRLLRGLRDLLAAQARHHQGGLTWPASSSSARGESSGRRLSFRHSPSRRPLRRVASRSACGSPARRASSPCQAPRTSNSPTRRRFRNCARPMMAGGTLTLCTQCAQRRDIAAGDVIEGVRIAGAATFLEESLAPDDDGSRLLTTIAYSGCSPSATAFV